MRYELNGTLVIIKDTQQVSDRFKKREFVVKTDEESPFPQYIPLQFTQDRCDNLDSFKQGQQVKVEFYIKGREWTSPQGEVKHFLSLDAWSIDQMGGSTSQESPSFSGSESIPPPPAPVNFDSDNSNDPDDDLPF